MCWTESVICSATKIHRKQCFTLCKATQQQRRQQQQQKQQQQQQLQQQQRRHSMFQRWFQDFNSVLFSVTKKRKIMNELWTWRKMPKTRFFYVLHFIHGRQLTFLVPALELETLAKGEKDGIELLRLNTQCCSLFNLIIFFLPLGYWQYNQIQSSWAQNPEVCSEPRLI